jgi:hypothetical protein
MLGSDRLTDGGEQAATRVAPDAPRDAEEARCAAELCSPQRGRPCPPRCRAVAAGIPPGRRSLLLRRCPGSFSDGVPASDRPG